MFFQDNTNEYVPTRWDKCKSVLKRGFLFAGKVAFGTLIYVEGGLTFLWNKVFPPATTETIFKCFCMLVFEILPTVSSISKHLFQL